MSMDDHRVKIRRLSADVISRGNPALIGEFLALDDIEYEALPPGITAGGTEGSRKFAMMVRTAFRIWRMLWLCRTWSWRG